MLAAKLNAKFSSTNKTIKKNMTGIKVNIRIFVRSPILTIIKKTITLKTILY